MIHKPRVLSLVQLPPPMHGAAAVNSEVVNSTRLNEMFDHDYIAIQLSTEIQEVGYLSFNKISKAISNFFRTAKFIIKNETDLVYFTIPPHGGGFYASVPLVLLLKIYRRKILYHFHGKGFQNSARNSVVYRSLIRWATRNTYAILLSERLGPDAEDLVLSDTLWFVPNFAPDIPQSHLKIEDGVPHLIFLSNLIESKGPLELVAALELLKLRGVSFRATFAGNPHPPITFDNFLSDIKTKDLQDCVAYAGPVYGKEKDALLRSADILVLPTRYPNEAFPLVVLEAMAYGLAVIATAEGAIPDMVSHDVNGFLVDPGDISGIADYLEQLISNPNLRKKMGEIGKLRIAESFSRNVFNEHMSEIWTEIIGDSA